MRDPKITHKIMASIKSKDTKPELLLRKALWKQGLRYRVNYKKLPGKPDIVFTKLKVAVFCDGDFWHGHNWALRGLSSFEEELDGYSEFWKRKILRNVQRDIDHNRTLSAMGWIVVRLWESEIKKDISECVSVVEDALFEAMLQQSNDENITEDDSIIF